MCVLFQEIKLQEYKLLYRWMHEQQLSQVLAVEVQTLKTEQTAKDSKIEELTDALKKAFKVKPPPNIVCTKGFATTQLAIRADWP